MNKHFHNLLLGVSVLPALAIMPAMAETITIDVTDADKVYTGHNGVGGALSNSVGDDIVTEGSHSVTFSGNKSTDHGAGFYYKNGTSDSSVVFNTNVSFLNNEVVSTATSGSGAGIFVSGGNVSLLGDVNTFDHNEMNAAGISASRLYKVGGGAIANQSYAKDFNPDKDTPLDATMVIGKAGGSSVNTFTNNTSTTNGGAIMNRALKDTTLGDNDGNAYLTINGTTTFDNNTATLKGGAIYNFANGGAVAQINMNNGTYIFTNNAAGERGGAIYNAGALTINNAIFGGVDDTDPDAPVSLGNTADEGGAIFNDTGIRSVVTNITNSQFINNSATSYGGAIDHRTGTMNITGSTFTNNHADVQGGAILLRLQPTLAEMHITNSTFTGNSAAEDGGAVSAFANLTVENTNFDSNSVDNGGGAILVGSESISTITGGLFSNNTSGTRGGAIATRDKTQGDNIAAKLDISGATFRGNTATTDGGAFYNDFFNSVTNEGYTTVASSIFENNHANKGGAIYNDDVDKAGNAVALNVTSGTFTGNTATTNGGAIYNEGILTLAGTNTFTGNIANDTANDIHNLGQFTIASGTTTIDGGITGTGALTIANGATLNIGTASVTQNTITLNGNMIATLRSGDDAQITATAENGFSGDGVLKLLLSNPGEYNVFGGSLFANYEWDESGITTESSVYDLSWTNDGKTVIASLKSIEDIADANDLEEDVATAVAGLNTSTSEKLNDLGVVVQEKLAEGTSEAKQEVEHIAKAIHPETESVVQSVATSIQHTVANLTSARMAAPMFGRNGGDVNFSSRGVWAQGLYNKSKKNDAFDGSTRGIAAGIDGTVDKTLMLGVGYSYADSDINGTARDTDIKSNTVFVYGQYKPAQWYVNAMANYTWSEYSEEDSLVTADYDVDSFGGVIATGYDFASGITPELGLRYIHINGETYTNSIDVKSELKSGDYLTAVLGTKYGFNIASKNGMLFRPELRYAVKYDFVSDKTLATVTMPGVSSYTLDGDRLSRIGGEFGIGLRIGYNGLDVSLNYDIEVREDYTSQTGMLKLRYDF